MKIRIKTKKYVYGLTIKFNIFKWKVLRSDYEENERIDREIEKILANDEPL